MLLSLITLIIILANDASALNEKNESTVEELLKNVGKALLKQPETTSVLTEIVKKLPNNTCVKTLETAGNNLLAPGKLALKLIDASSKPQTGLFLGNIMHIGNYDQCLELGHKYCTTIYDFHSIYGQDFYRKIMVEYAGSQGLNLPKNFTSTDMRKSYGFCVPKECNETELQIIANATEDALKFPLHFLFKDNYCNSQDGIPFTTSAIVATSIFGIFGALILSSTLYDVLCRDPKKPSLYACFSVVSNFKKIFSKTTQDEIRCLNGIRVISMMWMILIHRYVCAFYSPSVNAFQILEWRSKLENIFIIAGSMSVDTFFTISGLLVVYLYMKYSARGIKIPFGKFYFHRLLRLTPSLAMVILFTSTLLHHLGQGPFWFYVEQKFQRACWKHWWSTLLYVQNYVNPIDQCIQQSWYLAVDTQMYFLTPLLLVPLSKWPKPTIFTILGLIIVQSAYIFYITLVDHLPATPYDLDERLFTQLYFPTHVRGSPYLIGMLCGYYIFKKSSTHLKLRKWKVVALWLLSMLSLIGIIFSHTHFTKKYTPLEAAFFTSLTRAGWAVGLSVVITLCVNGYGGIINSFLSHNAFTVLIRLNYNVYLLHEAAMFLVVGQGRTPGYFSNMVMFHDFWGHYVFTLLMALVWTLTFESPIVAVERYFLAKRGITP